MSLILEALRKLDREKQTPERGFLIVGAAAWPAPPRRLRRLSLGVIGLVAAAAGTAAILRSPHGAPQPPAPPPAPRATAPPAVVLAATTRPAEPERSPAPAPRAAPPSSLRPTDPPAYHLTAISSKDGRPVAVLNDRLVFEGDSFEGVKVVRIGEAEVEIEVGGRRIVVAF